MLQLQCLCLADAKSVTYVTHGALSRRQKHTANIIVAAVAGAALHFMGLPANTDPLTADPTVNWLALIRPTWLRISTIDHPLKG